MSDNFETRFEMMGGSGNSNCQKISVFETLDHIGLQTWDLLMWFIFLIAVGLGWRTNVHGGSAEYLKRSLIGPTLLKGGAKCKGKGGLPTSYPSSSPFMNLCMILVGGSSRAGDRRRKRSYRTSSYTFLSNWNRFKRFHSLCLCNEEWKIKSLM